MIDAWRTARGLLERSHWFLLWVLGATAFFDGFDRGIVELALPQIRDTFDLSQADASLWLVSLYVGAIPALALTRRADRVGRRSLLLWCVVGYTVATGLTAAAPSIAAFAACQFVARLFINAESVIVWTMAAEEVPAGARGFAFGFLAMAEALGTGLAAILYGGGFAPAGISWRWMYVVGLPPLAFVFFMRRRLPESRRFVAARDEGRLAARWRDILEPPHRRWLVLVVITAFLVELTTVGGVFAIDFLQTDRGLSATASNFMLVFAGLPAIPAMVIAGSLSDRYGRRWVGCGFALLGLVGGMGFLWLPGGLPVLLPFMSLTLIGSLGAWPTLGAFAQELFPTALRGQAGAWARLARVAGQGGSLLLGAVLLNVTGSLSPTVTILGVGPVLAVAIFAIWFPDTHGRELEEIAGEAPFVAPVVGGG